MYKHLNKLLPYALHNLFTLWANHITRPNRNSETYSILYMWLSIHEYYPMLGTKIMEWTPVLFQRYRYVLWI